MKTYNEFISEATWRRDNYGAYHIKSKGCTGSHEYNERMQKHNWIASDKTGRTIDSGDAATPTEAREKITAAIGAHHKKNK